MSTNTPQPSPSGAKGPEIIQRAKDTLLDALNAPLTEWGDGDKQRVDLAKWVINHIEHLRAYEYE